MNIQLLSKFFFSYSTTLTGVIIAVACISALCLPVRAILISLNASIVPIEVLIASNGATFRFPLIKASLRAKLATSSMGLLNLKSLQALQTFFSDSRRNMGMSYFWFRMCFNMQVLSKAFEGTETNAAPFPFTCDNFLLADFAKLLTDRYITEVFDQRRLSGAFARTMIFRPTFKAPKFIATYRASLIDATRFLLALTRAVSLVLVRIDVGTECFSAFWTRFFNVHVDLVAFDT